MTKEKRQILTSKELKPGIFWHFVLEKQCIINSIIKIDGNSLELQLTICHTVQ